MLRKLWFSAWTVFVWQSQLALHTAICIFHKNSPPPPPPLKKSTIRTNYIPGHVSKFVIVVLHGEALLILTFLSCIHRCIAFLDIQWCSTQQIPCWTSILALMSWVLLMSWRSEYFLARFAQCHRLVWWCAIGCIVLMLCYVQFSTSFSVDVCLHTISHDHMYLYLDPHLTRLPFSSWACIGIWVEDQRSVSISLRAGLGKSRH